MVTDAYDDGRAAVLVTGYADRNGASASFDQIHLGRSEDGRTLSFQSYQDGFAEDDFWSS